MAMTRGWYEYLIIVGTALQSLLLLGMRLFWGYGFYTSGMGKLHSIASTTQYFETLGVAAPQVMAYVVGTIETVGGACFIVGFASRLVALSLIGTMVAAYLTAHYDALKSIVSNPEVFLAQPPFLFLLAALFVFSFGPGKISVDAIIKRVIGGERPNPL